MQRLILMRHARAEPGAAGGDRARPLSAEGLHDARRMGRALAERGFRPDLALVSDARRTRQTWDQVHEAMGDVEVRIESALYNASPDTLRHAVEAAEDHAGCLLVLAHNPGVHLLALDYLIESAASPALQERLAGFAPGAAAVFTIDAAGRPTYEGFLTPETLQP